MKKSITIILLSVFTMFQFQSFGQNEPTPKKTLNFFLDCYHCDFDFVRQELKFVLFVRDPKQADVHILSSSSQTGSGGTKYFLNFIGMNKLAEQNIEYEYFSEQSATRDERRKGLLKLIQTGVLHYYSKSGDLGKIEIDLDEKETKTVVESVDDPWNLWIVRMSAGSDFDKEASQNEFSLATEISIEKVTENWKTGIEANHEIDRENFFDDGEKIVNSQTRTNISADYIKSLTPKWSAGVFGDYSSTNYINIKNAFKFDVGAEYNIFPWDVSSRKVFALRYIAGINTYDYNEETIYNKFNETLFYEALGLNLEMVQPWGRVEISLEGRHYFHDFSKNRLKLKSVFSMRLTKQLSVYCELESQVIHDQLYLPKGDTSLEDLLLKRRKLATTYEVEGELGLRFTFGSIYNNVVNERF
ncbi:MAG: hypothetical protein HOA90_20370 [Prolixibacteraceae bacterium]|nr:hypothetical protein [Prolixibacteraceae bacterium]